MQDPNQANNPPDPSKGPPPPPNNPYGTPPISSPNQAPGYAAGAPPSASGRAGRVSLDALSDGWAALSAMLLPWIGAGLVCFVILFILGIIQRAVVGVPATATAFTVPKPTGASIVMQVISSAFSLFLSAAVFNMALHQLRTGRAEIGKMFEIGDVLGSLVIAGLLCSLIQSIGYITLQVLALGGTVLPPGLVLLLTIVPPIVTAVGLMMVMPLIVDRKLSGIDAIGRSFETMLANFGGGLLLIIVLVLVNILGACACLVGLLVTVPLSVLTVAFVYRDLFLGGTMGAMPDSPNVPPPPPIANPR